MHHELALLTNITVAILTAFVGGYVARKISLPPIAGYLLAGLAIGPFTPGFIGNIEDISQLAEMGVIFMMFGVGLHLSLHDLWRVRRIAIPGAILQMGIATLLGFALTRLWGWSIPAGLVLGLAISIASTVVLLRGLVDNGLLNTVEGQVAVGWLVLEDMATILILVLLPALLSDQAGNPWQNVGLALLKHDLHNHVIVVGAGRVGEHVCHLLDSLSIPYLVVDTDPVRASALQQRGIPTLLGDASNSEIMTHVGLQDARLLVVTLPDETAAEMVITAAHDRAPDLAIIVRASTLAGLQRLADHGAQDVIHPELEGGLEIVRHTMLALAYPATQAQEYMNGVRREIYKDKEFLSEVQ